MREIEEVFRLLEKWGSLPKYQLERRLDIFFAIYLKDILSECKNGKLNKEKIKEILPEFPLRKEDDSYATDNADYAVFVEENKKIKMYLVELKTEMNSIREVQNEYYKRASGKTLKEILNGIIEIEQDSKSKHWRKYNRLLAYLREMGIIELIKDEDINHRKKWKVEEEKISNEKIEIIYILPIRQEDNLQIISFEDVRKVLKNKGEFAKKFSKLLRRIELQNLKINDITKEDVLEYIAGGDEEELNNPEVQKLLLKYGFIDYLISTCKVIENKEIIKEVLSSKYLKEHKEIRVLKGKIEKIKIGEKVEKDDENLVYVNYEFIEKEKRYSIKDIVFSKEELEKIEKKIKNYKDNIVAIVKNGNEELNLQCFVKVYEGVNYESYNT